MNPGNQKITRYLYFQASFINETIISLDTVIHEHNVLLHTFQMPQIK